MRLTVLRTRVSAASCKHVCCSHWLCRYHPIQQRTIMSNISDSLRRFSVILSVVALIAVAHIFRVGSYLQGVWYNLYYSYFSDFILPFGCYFLLCANEPRLPIFRRWKVKLAIAFLTPSIAETCQYLGIPALGSTFDLFDYVMYGIGAISAVAVDTQVFSRISDFWTLEKAER